MPVSGNPIQQTERITMNTAQQNSFMTAAECLSFTAAAEKLYISQPVLSRNIAALEAELEVLLFVRRNNVLSLTPGGEIIYKWMKESQLSLADAIQKARQANREPQGELRIGFVTTELPSERETKALITFQKRYPNARLSVFHHSAKELIQQLTDHNIDIAAMLETELTQNPRFMQVENNCYRQCIVVSRAHPLAEQESVSLRDFSNDVFICTSKEYSPIVTGRTRQLCGAVGFVPRIREVASTTEQLEQVEARRGVALVVENHIGFTNPLVRVLPLKEIFPVRLLCVWDKLNMNPCIEDYLNIFKEQ